MRKIKFFLWKNKNNNNRKREKERERERRKLEIKIKNLWYLKFSNILNFSYQSVCTFLYSMKWIHFKFAIISITNKNQHVNRSKVQIVSSGIKMRQSKTFKRQRTSSVWFRIYQSNHVRIKITCWSFFALLCRCAAKTLMKFNGSPLRKFFCFIIVVSTTILFILIFLLAIHRSCQSLQINSNILN